MNNERLIEIIIELGTLYTSRRECTFRLWQIEKDTEGRKLNLTPPEGWPGKNEEQRRVAQGLAFEKDEALMALLDDLLDTRKKLLEFDDQIKIFENERRAIEWLIRGQMVVALSANHVDRSDGDVKDAAFDDAAQAALDQAATEQLQFTQEEQSWTENGVPPSVEQMQSEYFQRAFSTSGNDLPDDFVCPF